MNKFDPSIKKVKVSKKGYHFFKLNLAHVPIAVYQAAGPVALWFWRKRFGSFFFSYMGVVAM